VRHFSRFSRSGLVGCPVPSNLRDHATCKAYLERLHDRRGSLLLGFADQKMNVLGHYHIAGDNELIAHAYLLQYCQE